MNQRRGESSERVSALVLLAAGLFVSQWSRATIADHEVQLARREAHLERFEALVRGPRAVDPGQCLAMRDLFGAELQVVAVAGPVALGGPATVAEVRR